MLFVSLISGGFSLLRFAFQPCRAALPLFGSSILRIFELVYYFSASRQLPLNFALPFAAGADFERDCIAGVKPIQILCRGLSCVLAIDFKNVIAYFQTGLFGIAACGDGFDSHGTIKVTRGGKSGIGDIGGLLEKLQANLTEKIVPRDFFCARNVF